jgi:diaminopimelate epimerase
MQMRLCFEKWEGLGNDFIVIEHDSVEGPLADADIRTLCDRRRGIGADGVLLVSRREGLAGVMVVRNADGSRPEMCGNGIRCVAGYLLSGRSESASIVIGTDCGELGCHVDVLRDGEVLVEVGMGRARFEADLEVPIPSSTEEGREAVHRFAVVSMGNPHAITFDEYADAELDRIAPIVEKARTDGINVEVVRVEGETLVVRVWERGVGYTEACGTGACAVAAIACRCGISRFDADVTVRLPGGDLAIRVAEGTHEVRMRGPARRAFRGVTQLL